MTVDTLENILIAYLKIKRFEHSLRYLLYRTYTMQLHQHNPSERFLEKRTEILEQMMRYHASLIGENTCSGCGIGAEVENRLFRCDDCFHVKVKCRSCLLEGHKHLGAALCLALVWNLNLADERSTDERETWWMVSKA